MCPRRAPCTASCVPCFALTRALATSTTSTSALATRASSWASSLASTQSRSTFCASGTVCGRCASTASRRRSSVPPATLSGWANSVPASGYGWASSVPVSGYSAHSTGAVQSREREGTILWAQRKKRAHDSSGPSRWLHCTSPYCSSCDDTCSVSVLSAMLV